jgi:hypothetical protein
LQITSRPITSNPEVFAAGVTEVPSTKRPCYLLSSSVLEYISVLKTISKLYTLFRLSDVENLTCSEVLDKLDANVGTLFEVASITRLHDGSWEMVVLKAYRKKLMDKLLSVLPGCTFDWRYDPFQPLQKDVNLFGSDTARKLNVQWTLERVERMIETAWPISAAYYLHLKECGSAESDRLRCRL